MKRGISKTFSCFIKIQSGVFLLFRTKQQPHLSLANICERQCGILGSIENARKVFSGLFFLLMLVMQTQLYAKNITVDGAAGVALVGQLGILDIIEPSTAVKYKQFIADNAKEVNEHVMALLDKYEYDSLPDRPFNITEITKHTKGSDPMGR